MTMLNAALDLARGGLPVFPCRRDKKPTTPHGFLDASTAPDIVRRLWLLHPGPLIGVPTGPASGLFVVDVDSPRHPEAAAWLARHAVNMPQTRTHRTRSGGVHLLYRHRPGLRTTAAKLAHGVDTRGDGGYIIWWPAVLASDVSNDIAIPDAPQWLLDALAPPPPPPSPPSPRIFHGERARDIEAIVCTVACAQEGRRNALAFWGACRLAELSRAGRIGRISAIDLAVAAACRAGLPRPEAQRTAHSAFRTVGA